ncbi:MAG: tRNA (adenosine(37)-N6)-dimethylallyltransferase MiaA [Pseudomonadota bacterium]
MGPTASGKTDLALSMADEFPCEIISVDSVMVYRDLNIGSAKPSQEILQNYPHHLVDIIDPEESYSVANFCNDALSLINQSHVNKKIPLLVGGTMLYFNALLHGLSKMPSANQKVRNDISQQADDLGWEALHKKLKQIDPNSAERIHPNDPQRIQRALEVYELTGTPISEWHAETKSFELGSKILKLALIPEDRADLHRRIEQRFDHMLAEGFIEEVRELRNREMIHAELPAMRSVGYRQVWAYLDDKYDAKEMREKAIVATRQFAKRQLTWLRSEADLNTVPAEKYDIHDVRQQIEVLLA